MTFTAQQIQDRLALEDLVDTFSNLADEKRVADQLPLFTEDAEVTTIIAGKVFAQAKGHKEIGEVFSSYLAQFRSVYHLNGQHTITFTGTDTATAINYCHVVLVQEKDGKQLGTFHYVRYEDSYVRTGGQWLIGTRRANFMISETREMQAAG